MPRVSAFRGIGYAFDRFGASSIPDRVRIGDGELAVAGRIADLSDIICPPYDVIGDAQRAELLERHPRNAVRLELNPAADPHAAAAETLAAWLADGTLVRGNGPAMYAYRYASPGRSDDPSVAAVLARVLLEPWGDRIRPHEHTMPGPKADRLALLRATRTQLSPILALYFDGSERYGEVMDLAWTEEWRARDADGLLHAVAAVEPSDRLIGYLDEQTLFVADGHHRYETALAYQAEVRSDARYAEAALGALAADWIMVAMVNAEVETLEILPTHRLLVDVPANALARLTEVGSAILATPWHPNELAAELDRRRDDPVPTFGLVLPGRAFLLVADPGRVAERMAQEPMSPAARGLDLAVLHAAVLDDVLGITPSDVAAGKRLAYTRSATDAIERVTDGTATAAILVRPTRIDQLAAVASAGDVMPQKSTYFYPKLLTGFVFNPLEE